MDVVDGLAAFLTAVHDEAIPVRTEIARKLRCDGDEMAGGAFAFTLDELCDRRHVFARQNENVLRRLGIHVDDRDNVVVTIDFLRLYIACAYLTENAIHGDAT